MTRSCRCGKSAFLSVTHWPSCCVTLRQFCHNAWGYWHSTHCITQSRSVDVLTSCAVNAVVGGAN